MLRVRLGLMMFLQYFVWGAWSVTLGTWLGTTLHASGQQIGWAAGTTAIGAIVSPFFVGLVADRWYASQKVLAVLHGLGAVLLAVASRQTQFGGAYVALLAYALCYMPTLALSNSIAFRQMQSPQEQFGAIRSLGTLGWIVAGILIGGMGIEASATPLMIAAGCSLALAVYSWTLPDTPPLDTSAHAGLAQIVPREAIALFKSRSMAVFALSSFLICIPLQFYYAFTNLFLNENSVHQAAAKMTGGQMSELICMLLIPWFFRRLGVKYMLGLGMLAWVLRYLLFAYGNATSLVWMFWAGILLHGISYDFFFVVGQIFVDRQAPRALRAAAQGIITLITYGAGMLVGSWLSGRVVDAFVTASGPVGHDWHGIWLVAGGCAVAVLLLFMLLFKEQAGPVAASASAR